MTTYYKSLRADGRCLYGGRGRWPLRRFEAWDERSARLFAADCAESAARAASWAAERDWQTERLFAYLRGEVSA